MLTDSILQAFQLFVLGMGTVFFLLFILILSVTLVSIFLKKTNEKKSDSLIEKNKSKIKAAEHDLTIAAATMAVTKYKNHQKNK